MYRIAFRLMKLACLGLFIALLAGSVSLMSAAPAAPPAYYKLSSDGPLPIGGDVHSFEISASGMYTVYQAGQEISEVRQLYAVRSDGSQDPVKVSALPDRRRRIVAYVVSPDNAHVVYNADQDNEDIRELYSAPLDGSAAPTKLSGEMVENGGLPENSAGFNISPDGSRVVYRADQETDEVYELYSVPVDGSAAAVKLNATLPAGGGTNSYEISPDSQYLLYTADQDTDNVFELYRVPLDGSAAPVKLSGALVAGGAVSYYFKISPDSTYVVYLADQETDNVIELYMVPLDGSAAPIKLNGLLVAGGNVGFSGTFYISPDSQWVVYLADQDTNDVDELYSVPIGGGAAVKLNPPLVPGGEVSWVWDAQISPDSSRVVYLADQEVVNRDEIFSVPIAGGVATKLNGPLAGNLLYDFAISPNSSRVVYRALQDSATQFELYSVPLAGGTPTKLNGALISGGQVNSFRISADSSRVVFMADKGTTSGNEIYRVPLAGGSVTKVNGALTTGGRVFRYDIAPDSSRVVYIADQDMSGVDELYRTPLASPGPVSKLNETLAIGADIWSFEITSDSQYVLYLADQTRIDRNDLYRARLDGSDEPARLIQGLAGNYTMYDLEVTPDAVWAVITVDVSGEPDALYSVPVDGSGPPILLNTTALSNARLHYFRLSDDSNYVVYRAEEDTSGVFEIYSAPVDGSGAQTKLNGALVAGGEVQSFGISPDSTQVVYTADQETDEVVELYSVPIGGGATTKLNAPLPATGEIRNNNFSISPDGAWVAYIADQDTDEVFELYLVPTDGSAAPVKVNGTLVTDGDVSWFRFSPTGNALAYNADQDVDEQFELFGVSLPGPGAPVRLNAPLGPGFSVGWFEFSPDGAFVVYVASSAAVPNAAKERFDPDGTFVVSSADQQTDEQDEIYSVALPDGAPVKLSQSLNPDERIGELNFSPDSSFLLYTIYTGMSPVSRFLRYSGMGETNSLYSVRPDGSGEPRQVNDPLVDGGAIGSYRITGNSDRVVYEARDEAGVYELYSARSDGRGAVAKFSIPLVEGGSIHRYSISPDDSRVVYQADQDINEVEELYAVTLPELELNLFLPVILR